MRKALVAALPLLMLTACGSDESADDGPLTLTFDGSSCVYEGPDTLSPGSAEFSFSNETEEIATHAIVHITADDITLDDVQRLSETDPEWDGSPGSLGEGGAEIVSGGTTTMPDRSTESTVDLTAGPYYFVCMYNSLENFTYGGGITVEP
ncbi:MAG: hypothetical protein WBL31_02035 [Ilumatobacteraceae bacterium]|jgi:hypothetical protein